MLRRRAICRTISFLRVLYLPIGGIFAAVARIGHNHYRSIAPSFSGLRRVEFRRHGELQIALAIILQRANAGPLAPRNGCLGAAKDPAQAMAEAVLKRQCQEMRRHFLLQLQHQPHGLAVKLCRHAPDYIGIFRLHLLQSGLSWLSIELSRRLRYPALDFPIRSG